MSFRVRVAFRSALLLGTAFAAGWLLLPQSEGSKPIVEAKRVVWFLEELPRRMDQIPLAARAAAGGYWGIMAEPTPAAASPPEDRSWRVSAIFGAGADRRLMISFRNPALPARTLKVGDRIPSGHEITQIGERDYCVLIGGATFRLGVERSEQ